MEKRSFKPSRQYENKLRLVVSLIAFLILVGGLLLAWLIALDDGVRAGRIFATVVVIIDVAYWFVGMVLAGPYYGSLRYEIRDEEVIVHVGIWTKSVKHVPYRTVTNLAVKRDILDRWFFGIGTLNIQTAGMSGQKGAEEKLVGLPNVQEVYEMVAKELRRFRGSMAPTTTDVETPPTPRSAETFDAILAELRAIRRTMEK